MKEVDEMSNNMDIFCECGEYLGEKNIKTDDVVLEKNIKCVVDDLFTSCNCPYCNKINYIQGNISGKFEIKNYLKWGKDLLNSLKRINLDGWKEFENDTFKIIPFDWDGLQDCNCNFDKEVNELYNTGESEENIENYENTHIHDINCNFRRTNFYHKSTGVSIQWYKHVDNFEYINKNITYKQWQEIIKDCVKSILKSNYIDITNKTIVNINLNNEVRFKPTKLGLSIIKNNTYFSPKDNIDDIIKTLYQYDGTYMITELWDFMNLFGKYFNHGINTDELPCDMNFEIIKE